MYQIIQQFLLRVDMLHHVKLLAPLCEILSQIFLNIHLEKKLNIPGNSEIIILQPVLTFLGT